MYVICLDQEYLRDTSILLINQVPLPLLGENLSQ